MDGSSNSNNLSNKLIKACDEFYTRVPHDFGSVNNNNKFIILVTLLPLCPSPSPNVPLPYLSLPMISMRTPQLIKTKEIVKQKLTLLEVSKP